MQFLLWLGPLILAAAYSFTAFDFRRRMLERFQQLLKADPTPARKLAVVLLKAPATWFILLIALALVFMLWPLIEKVAVFVFSGLRIGLVAGLTFTAHQVIRVYSEQAGKDAFISHALVHRLLIVSVYAAGGFMILALLGVPVLPLIIALSAGLVLIALGIRETLANYLAGFYLAFNRPVTEGDFVRLASVEGRIESIGQVNTRVRTLRGALAIIPNRRMLEESFENFGDGDTTVFSEVPVVIETESSMELLTEAALETARNVLDKFPDLAGAGEPKLYFRSIGDDGTDAIFVMPARNLEAVEPLRHQLLAALYNRALGEDSAPARLSSR